PLAHLIEEFGALRHDAYAFVQPGNDQHPIAIERLEAHRARFEPLGRAVLEDEILAVLAAHDARARNRNASLLLLGRGQHGNELTGTQPADITLDPEMHRHRLIAIGKAGALIAQ